MLKILKMGDETHKIYHVTCYNCGCVFETNYDNNYLPLKKGNYCLRDSDWIAIKNLDEDDVFETDYDKKIMSRNYASLLFTIECPCCGEVNNSDDYKIRYLSKKEYEEWKKNPDKPEVLKTD